MSFCKKKREKYQNIQTTVFKCYLIDCYQKKILKWKITENLTKKTHLTCNTPTNLKYYLEKARWNRELAAKGDILV